MYTDGLSEAFAQDGEFFGEKRIMDTLNNTAGQSADDVLKAIENKLDEFVGEEMQSDDLTLLLLRRK